MEDLRIYKQNLTEFVNNLPTSDVKFLHFVRREEHNAQSSYIAKINKTARLWNVSNQLQRFIVPNAQQLLDYCYLFKESNLKYEIDTDVSGHEVRNYAQVGGTIQANWGNHLTVGIISSRFARVPLLRLHITTYGEDSLQNNAITRETEECNVFLNNVQPDAETKCVRNGQQMMDTLSLLVTQDEDIVNIIQSLHKHITKKSGGCRNTTTKGCVHIGPKGGRYIINNGKKIYVKHNGGTMNSWIHDAPHVQGFTSDFETFVISNVLDRICQVRPELAEAYIIDDVTSDYFVVRYIFGEFPATMLADTFLISKSSFKALYNMPASALQQQQLAILFAISIPSTTEISANA